MTGSGSRSSKPTGTTRIRRIRQRQVLPLPVPTLARWLRRSRLGSALGLPTLGGTGGHSVLASARRGRGRGGSLGGRRSTSSGGSGATSRTVGRQTVASRRRRHALNVSCGSRTVVLALLCLLCHTALGDRDQLDLGRREPRRTGPALGKLEPKAVEYVPSRVDVPVDRSGALVALDQAVQGLLLAGDASELDHETRGAAAGASLRGVVLVDEHDEAQGGEESAEGPDRRGGRASRVVRELGGPESPDHPSVTPRRGILGRLFR